MKMSAENARYAKPNGETWYASTSTTSGISSASETNYPENFQNLKSAVNLPQYNYSAGQNHYNQHSKQGYNAQTIEYVLQKQQVPTQINLKAVRGRKCLINVRGEEVSFMSSARQGENFAMEQQKDQDIKWIRELMKKHGTHKPEKVAIGNKDRKIYFREYDNLEIKNNLLYRLYKDNQARKFSQLVLPKSSLQRVIEESHSRKSSGHLGNLKTFKKLRKRFFSPCLKKDIKDFVKKFFV